MALKSSRLWFRRNWRKTSSRFFTSRGPCTIRADFCRDKGHSQPGGLCGDPEPQAYRDFRVCALTGKPILLSPLGAAPGPGLSTTILISLPH